MCTDKDIQFVKYKQTKDWTVQTMTRDSREAPTFFDQYLRRKRAPETTIMVTNCGIALPLK